MSHPKVCPCPNCIVAGKGPGLILMALALVAAALAVVQLCRWSAAIGRLPFVVAGLVAFALVSLLVGACVRGSLREGRTVELPVSGHRREESPAPALPAPAEPVPALPAPEPMPAPLRLVRRDEVA